MTICFAVGLIIWSRVMLALAIIRDSLFEMRRVPVHHSWERWSRLSNALDTASCGTKHVAALRSPCILVVGETLAPHVVISESCFVSGALADWWSFSWWQLEAHFKLGTVDVICRDSVCCNISAPIIIWVKSCKLPIYRLILVSIGTTFYADIDLYIA